jgi:arylsulfatase B
LAYNGIILDRFYTQSACTPSRAALLTGQYPIRLGVQVIPMRPGEDLALPVDVSIMPEHFKQLGYKTHLVGKWHQGMSYRRNLPTQRGFDTHFGYWNGFVGYFDYVANGIFPNGTVSTTIRNVVSRSLMVLLVLGSQGI